MEDKGPDLQTLECTRHNKCGRFFPPFFQFIWWKSDHLKQNLWQYIIGFIIDVEVKIYEDHGTQGQRG